MVPPGRTGTRGRRLPVTAPAAGRIVTTTARPASGIGRPALLIAVITVVANVVGFGRQLVFAHTVGATPLGTAYATANQVPNIIYAIVLGGALTGMAVPVLAGPALAGLKGDTRQTSSALLTWTLLLLVPVSLAVALAARPMISALLGSAHGSAHSSMLAVGSRMLVVFAPQIVLYGLAVVGYGILQAHRRFTFPALAPVLSSIVVAAAYIAFVPLSHGNGVRHLPRAAELMLSVGTTAGVAALAVTALVPVLRLRLGLRLTLRFPPGVAARVRALTLAGITAVIAQNLSTAVVIVLANAHGGPGALVLYNYGWQLFFVPYAVLAVPIATSAFPVLSAAAQGAEAQGREAAARAPGSDAPGSDAQGSDARGSDARSFDAAAASSTRAAALVSWLGAALLAGACVPAARVFVAHESSARELAWTLAAFAPGLAGFGLAASLTRVLLAGGRTRIAGAAITGGWLLVIAADLVIVPLVPRPWVVPALGLGNTAGLIAGGLALLAMVRRARGGAAQTGVTRAFAAGLSGALVGAAAGAAAASALRVHGFAPNAGVALLACACTALVFGLVVLALAGAELTSLAGMARARLARSR